MKKRRLKIKLIFLLIAAVALVAAVALLCLFNRAACRAVEREMKGACMKAVSAAAINIADIQSTLPYIAERGRNGDICVSTAEINYLAYSSSVFIENEFGKLCKDRVEMGALSAIGLNTAGGTICIPVSRSFRAVSNIVWQIKCAGINSYLYTISIEISCEVWYSVLFSERNFSEIYVLPVAHGLIEGSVPEVIFL